MTLIKDLLTLEKKIQEAEAEEESRRLELKEAREATEFAIAALRKAVCGEEQPDLPFPAQEPKYSVNMPFSEQGTGTPPAEPAAPAPEAPPPEPPKPDEFDKLNPPDNFAKPVLLREVLTNSTDKVIERLAEAELRTVGELYAYIASGKKLTDLKGLESGKKGIGPGKASIIEEDFAKWLRLRFEHLQQTLEGPPPETPSEPGASNAATNGEAAPAGVVDAGTLAQIDACD